MIADTPAQAALFVFFLLVHGLVLHSAEEERCPPDFCNDVGSCTHFPFRCTKQPPECGLYTLNCTDSSDPRIQLKEGGYWHQLGYFPLTNPIGPIVPIGINDTDLDRLFEIDSCNDDFFESLSLPIASPTLDVLLVTPTLTVFKCSNPVDNTSFVDLHYACSNAYHTYYIPSRNSLRSPPPIPPPCTSIQLPVKPDQSYNLSALITFTFDLRVDMSACHECLWKKGICLVDNGKFKCDEAKGDQLAGDQLALKLGLAIGLGGTALLAAILFICCLRMKLSSHRFIFFWKKQSQSCQTVEAFLRNNGPLQVRRYNYSRVKKMTNSFKEKLGQGGYGSVYKGKLNDGCLVAVKVLSKLKGNGEEFMNEVAAISRTSHVNIVTLLGFCFEGSKRALIYEFMPNGSLEKFIFDAKTPQQDYHLGWEALDRISLGVARGLEYLHRGCNTRILHFDIKPHNILLDEDFTPKIADFGLAKICNMKESIVSMLCARGTAGYIAPEVFSRNFGAVTHKSDVYSYGMMLSEMVGGRRNIDVGVEDTSEIYFPHWIYKRIEVGEELGLHSILNDEDRLRARKMIIVSLWCIQTDPSNRPAMKQVIEMLEGSVDALQIPPKPFLASPPKSPADSSTTLVSIQ